MSVDGARQARNPQQAAWTDEVRHAALVAVEIAGALRTDDQTFAYFLRSALAHGVTLPQVAAAACVTPAEVLELTDPAVA